MTSSLGEYIEPRSIADRAKEIADGIFAGGPAGLRIKVAFFRGDDGSPEQQKKQAKPPKHPRQLRMSDRYYTSAAELAQHIAVLEPWGGWTQHVAMLECFVKQAEQEAVDFAVIVSDAFERQTPRRPNGDDVAAAKIHARRLRDLGVTLTIGFKGRVDNACPLDRAGSDAAKAFTAIAEANGGYCFLCNPAGDPRLMFEAFRKIGEQTKLQVQGDLIGAQLMLEHQQQVPFDLQVGEMVLSARCTSNQEEE
jgi:hypothetical protein